MAVLVFKMTQNSGDDKTDTSLQSGDILWYIPEDGTMSFVRELERLHFPDGDDKCYVGDLHRILDFIVLLKQFGIDLIKLEQSDKVWSFRLEAK